MDEELRELVVDDVERSLRGTFLEDAPVLSTSAVTGEGVEDLLGALNRLMEEIPERSTEGIFRMPIQRVFSAKGHGTIVTGIPISGRAKVGDPLEIQPGGATGRVRGVQAYHCRTDSARAGHSSALNLSDVNYREVRRGQTVVTPDTFQATRLIEARLESLPSLRKPLKHLTTIRFHTGTVEEIGRVAVLDGGDLGPGGKAYVQIRLDRPVVAAPGDRFVIRLHSPMVTVGGGEIIGASQRRLKSGREPVLERLREKEQAVGQASMTLATLVKETGLKGMARDDLKRASLLAPGEFDGQMKGLVDRGEIVELTRPVRYIHRAGLVTLQDRIVQTLKEFHEEEPLRIRMPRGALEQRTGSDRQPVDLALSQLEREGRVIDERDGGIRLQDHRVRLSSRQEEIAGRLLELYLTERYTTARREELSDRLGESKDDLRPVLTYLLEKEDLQEVGDGVIFHREAVEEASRLALETIDKEGELTVVRFKDVVGSTRKYVVPLLEHLDARGVTVRDGNRRLAASREGGESTAVR